MAIPYQVLTLFWAIPMIAALPRNDRGFCVITNWSTERGMAPCTASLRGGHKADVAIPCQVLASFWAIPTAAALPRNDVLYLRAWDPIFMWHIAVIVDLDAVTELTLFCAKALSWNRSWRALHRMPMVTRTGIEPMLPP